MVAIGNRAEKNGAALPRGFKGDPDVHARRSVEKCHKTKLNHRSSHGLAPLYQKKKLIGQNLLQSHITS